jgi:hypothetical protein
MLMLRAAVLALALLGAGASAASAQTANHCPAGQAATYVAGFAELRSRLGDWMGTPLTCEYADPNQTGDVHQTTSKGLAFWRKRSNTPTFTNGTEHWALTSRGLVYWTGSSIDPAADAVVTAGNPDSGIGAPPTFQGQRPDACDWSDRNWGDTRVYLCIYHDGTGAWFQQAGTGWTLLGSSARAATGLTYTEAGRQLLGIPVLPAGASLPAVSAYAVDTEQRCFNTNPSCARDPWWVEWNELQDASYVRYSAIGTGLVTEARFREAVNLLWQWPEGKDLLRSANQHRVGIVAGTSSESSYASFRPAFSLIIVNTRFTEVSTWMLADVLGHELRHATDSAQGLWKERSPENCVAAEQSAYSTERRFLVWLSTTLHPDGLPRQSELLRVVSAEDQTLARNLYEIATSGNLSGLVRRDYHETCAS